MRLIAANQPFKLGEFTATPSVLTALCRSSGLISLSRLKRQNDAVVAANHTTAKTKQAGKDNVLAAP